MKKIYKAMTGVAVGALMAVGAAQAANVSSTLFAGLNQLSDNSAESLIDMGGSVVGRVDKGDRLRGVFGIGTVEDLSGGGGTRSLLAGSGNNQLAGIFDITVFSKTDLGVGAGNARFQYVFVPTATFGTGLGVAGAMVAFYENVAHTYERLNPACTVTGSGNNCEKLVTVGSGAPLWVAGNAGNPNAFWVASAFTDDIGLIGAAGPASVGGVFNMGLDLLQNNSTRQFNSVACGFPAVVTNLEFCASGSLLGKGGAATPYDSFDNVDFLVNVVPEPTTIALSGLALLALAAASRRRKV